MAKILIVEDESIVAMNLQHELQTLGHTVVGIADNAVRAKELAVSASPEIVFMDIQLKGDINGADLAKDYFVKTSAKVIFMSGSPIKGLLDEGCDLINKPFSYMDIKDALKRVLK